MVCRKKKIGNRRKQNKPRPWQVLSKICRATGISTQVQKLITIDAAGEYAALVQNQSGRWLGEIIGRH